jgi:hypothetical protein
MSFAFFMTIRRWSRSHFARTFGWIAVVLLVAALLEAFVPLVKAASDSFRETMYRQQYLYAADARDIQLLGRIRPKVFTEEPSYLALFFVLALHAWFATSRTSYRILKFAAGAAVAMFVIGSPIILFALPLALFNEMAARRLVSPGTAKTQTSARVIRIMVVAVGVGVFLAATVLSRRLENFGTTDSSTVGRLIAPGLLAASVLREYPLLGVGVGGHEVMLEQIAKVFGGFGFQIMDPNKIVNAFWLFMIYYGFLGAAVFLWMLNGLMKTLHVRHRLYCLMGMLVFSQGMGAFVGMRFWLFAFTLFLISWHLDVEHYRDKPSQATPAHR